MNRLLIPALGALALSACAMEPNAGRYPPPAVSSEEAGTGQANRAAIAAAVADTARPQADRDRDANRHPAETLAFARVAPGERIVDLLPGGGYFTRLFARAVGSEGRVYAYLPDGAPEQYVASIQPVVGAANGYGNVSLLRGTLAAFAPGEPVDLVFTAQNYHDLHNTPADIAAYNRHVFEMVRPGGLYVIIDHSAVDGAPMMVTRELHRIDQAVVRREVEAAGFVFDGESPMLRNAADPRTATVFDPSIRGHTDQFAMRFRRPLP